MCGESKSRHCFHAGSSIQNHLEEAVQGDPEALEAIPADCMRIESPKSLWNEYLHVYKG